MKAVLRCANCLTTDTRVLYESPNAARAANPLEAQPPAPGLKVLEGWLQWRHMRNRWRCEMCDSTSFMVVEADDGLWPPPATGAG